ncbi:MAG: alpha/beta fold hydrolase [Gemmatimonadota bacterium]
MKAPLLIALLACAVTAAMPAAGRDLSPCFLKGIAREVQCGVIDRPENPDAADGRRIPIHFAVIPALAKTRAGDPLFVFAGGPGQSAMNAAALIEPVFAQLNARRDIVYVDQRGTGKSNRLACELPPPTAPLAAQLDTAASTQRLQRCLRRIASENRADLRQYATWIAVRDIDAVRAALGYDRINLWGGSYGTRMALEYLRQFPRHVRSVVLDGVAPPDMRLPTSLSIDADAMLSRLTERCETDPACRAKYPDFSARLGQLLASTDRAALKVELDHPLTGARETVAIDQPLIAAALRAPLYAPVLSAVLPHAVATATHGEFGPLLTLAGALTGSLADDFAEAMHYAVICAEDMPRIDGASRAAALRTRFGLSFVKVYDDVCPLVAVRPVPADFYAIPPADAPVLILSGGSDPATPPRHGDAVAKRLKNSLHLVAPNLGHGVSSHGCAPDLITRFVRQAGFAGIDGACLAGLPAPTFFAMPRAEEP